MTIAYYLNQPKKAIERKFIKILDTNPNLIKQFNNLPHPLFRDILFKCWGLNIFNQLVIACNWIEEDPKIPTQDPLEIIKSH